MKVNRVTPREAERLLGEGPIYVDVRSEPEFEAGHPPGAFNVPLLHAGPVGLVPNPEFLTVMERAFGKSEKLVMGCRSGQRSLSAAEMLLAAGYTDVSNLTAGFEGSRDPFGRVLLGWRAEGLPVEQGKPEGASYADTKRRTPL